jgi:hypothetical protein
VASRRVRGPDGREWVVRSYRFRRPPWRSFTFSLLDDLEDLGGLFAPVLALLVVLPLGIVTVAILPLLVYLAELPLEGVRALVSPTRWIEALHAGRPPSRMRWRTDSKVEEAVVEQVARQLELGYERIQPHRADFLGFG